MAFNNENISLSYVDIKKKIVLPRKPSKELAEFLGILAGDGHIGSLQKGKDHIVAIAGHATDDIEYLKYVKNLIKNLFNMKMILSIRRNINTAYLVKRSKAIVLFLNLIRYRKIHCITKIPPWIWKNKTYANHFIKGLFDTDGSIALKKNHGKYEYYPVISITSKDKKLICDVAKYITIMSIPYYVGYEKYLDARTSKIYPRYKLQISGYKNAKKWIDLIGTSNPKQKEKMGKGGFSENTFEPPIVENQAKA